MSNAPPAPSRRITPTVLAAQPAPVPVLVAAAAPSERYGAGAVRTMCRNIERRLAGAALEATVVPNTEQELCERSELASRIDNELGRLRTQLLGPQELQALDDERTQIVARTVHPAIAAAPKRLLRAPEDGMWLLGVHAAVCNALRSGQQQTQLLSAHDDIDRGLDLITDASGTVVTPPRYALRYTGRGFVGLWPDTFTELALDDSDPPLAVVDVSYNRLRHVHRSVFDSDDTARVLRHLVELNLSNNELLVLPVGLQRLGATLQELDVSNCRLAELHTRTLPLAALRRLALTSNRLTQLPADLAAPVLEELSVADNMLAAVAFDAWQTPRLQWLDLSHNALRALPASVARLGALEELLLDGNVALTALPTDALLTLRHLSYDVAFVAPSTVPERFRVAAAAAADDGGDDDDSYNDDDDAMTFGELSQRRPARDSQDSSPMWSVTLSRTGSMSMPAPRDSQPSAHHYYPLSAPLPDSEMRWLAAADNSDDDDGGGAWMQPYRREPYARFGSQQEFDFLSSPPSSQSYDPFM